ncbi:hypothetical protein [Enterococcus sp. BWR-S5]|uniref:hypothetical protein n=1 Tax=Enterococcus sp. BWR-S5 TaxID=2787714 RepID=UPI0019231FF9|nr:hypothetical protein [Enterococcus sp. BWR-S5]MBL1225392.1 hypothetical protein [Enterococcus sp. BWR-S5]
MNPMKIFHVMREEIAELERLNKRIDELERHLDDDDIRPISVARFEVTDKELRNSLRETIDKVYNEAVDEKREFVKSAANRMQEFLEDEK